MMTVDQLIDGLIAREGGYVDLPADKGGCTRYGITSATLGMSRGYGRPATCREVQNLTEDEARTIYKARYIAPFLAVPDDAIRAQLVDIAVTSGTGDAIKVLQRALGVTADGLLGQRTREALNVYPFKLTNQAMVAQRVTDLTHLVANDPSQRAFYFGWVSRAVGFL